MREKLMPMCPFCNRETTYVVPNKDGTFHCMNCGGDFDKNGNPTVPPDDDDDDMPTNWLTDFDPNEYPVPG